MGVCLGDTMPFAMDDSAITGHVLFAGGILKTEYMWLEWGEM